MIKCPACGIQLSYHEHAEYSVFNSYYSCSNSNCNLIIEYINENDFEINENAPSNVRVFFNKTHLSLMVDYDLIAEYKLDKISLEEAYSLITKTKENLEFI